LGRVDAEVCMKNLRKKRGHKVTVCATPVGPCVSAEGPGLHPAVAVVGGVAVAVAIVKLIKALSS
jgi:hypothetical protein